MCFDFDAHPPELPARFRTIAGAAPPERVTLTSADGTQFSAAIAEAPSPNGGPAVLIYPDVRGLYAFYEELAERFAQAGHHAVVIDYFGRTAGLGPRDEEFDFWPHVRALDLDRSREDAAAAIAALRERVGADTKVVAVGFCMGGSQAYLAAAAQTPDFAAVVGFYGGLNGERLGFPNAMDEIGSTQIPVLALFGGADEGIPAADRAVFEGNLKQSGVEYTLHVYDGAPHSFFDRKFEQFADECADAWTRTLDFLAAR